MKLEFSVLDIAKWASNSDSLLNTIACPYLSIIILTKQNNIVPSIYFLSLAAGMDK